MGGRRLPDERGFTLLEVMVALALLGGLLMTLLYTLKTHLDAAARHETYTVATMLGREKLMELGSGAYQGPMSGRFPEPDGDYSFRAERKPGPYPGLSEVSVEVERGGDKVVLREMIREGRGR